MMNIFVASLGVHCGMTYANSRTAIGVSLGTVFFLFSGCGGLHDHDGQVQQQFSQPAATVPGVHLGWRCRTVRGLGDPQSITGHHAGLPVAALRHVLCHHQFPVAQPGTDASSWSSRSPTDLPPPPCWCRPCTNSTLPWGGRKRLGTSSRRPVGEDSPSADTVLRKILSCEDSVRCMY